MMTVTQLARETGATADAVRYYTRMGLLLPVRNPENGYRLYKTDEINWLKFIRQAKDLGFTLHEIQEIMQDRDAGHSPCPRVRQILENRIVENRQRLDEMQALQQRMEDALTKWSKMTDGMPRGSSVCHLIESVDTDP